MPTKVLVAYTSNAGSTGEVAEAVARELRKAGTAVEVRCLEEIEDLSAYEAVVVGGPMIMGWHREAVKFLKKHQGALSRIPVAYFFTAMSLTSTGDTHLNGVPVHIDSNLPKDAKNAARLSFRERYATVERYLGPVLRAAPQVRPVSAGFFGGKLDYSRLKLLQMLFVMLIIQVQPGDRRNWPAVQEWAAGLSTAFNTAVE
jgi:menaquinone-dependent protoporphyrinogen IX oxidase